MYLFGSLGSREAQPEISYAQNFDFDCRCNALLHRSWERAVEASRLFQTVQCLQD